MVFADSKIADKLVPHSAFVTFASVPKVAMLANKVIAAATQMCRHTALVRVESALLQHQIRLHMSSKALLQMHHVVLTSVGDASYGQYWSPSEQDCVVWL